MKITEKHKICIKLYKELTKIIKNKILIKIEEKGLIINVRNKLKNIQINLTNEEIRTIRIFELANIVESRLRRAKYEL